MLEISRRTFYALVVMALLLTSIGGVLAYGYSSFGSIYPTSPPTGIRVFKVPYHGLNYTIFVESYISPFPVRDLNTTLQHRYSKITFVVGSPYFKDCKEGNVCVWRMRTSIELGAMLGALAAQYYYEDLINRGISPQRAKDMAAREAPKLIETKYLTFMTKVQIGLGRVGNENDLLVLLRGPEEGGSVNRIYVPRKGVVVLEASTEENLFVEVLLLKTIVASPVGNITEKKSSS